MTNSTYIVRGMTCDHCVKSVTEELTQIDGVLNVDVDLASGQVVVTSETLLDTSEVQSAIDEAGYELMS